MLSNFPAELYRLYPEAARAESEHLKGTIARLEEQIDDLKDQRAQLRADVALWRAMATQKRLTWQGLFGARESAE